MIECCKDGVCYICTEDKWENEYKPKGFKRVEPEKAEAIPDAEPVEVAETPVASTPKPRGRRK